jgi:hypothetical protein
VAIATILLGAGGLLVLAGLWMIASHFASRPPRYGSPARFDADGPLRRQIGKLPAGLVLICAGAAMFLVAALVVQSN